jgi:lipopolysaccharide biosynthesis glycosyltransferase
MSEVHVACCFDDEMVLPALILASSVRQFGAGGRKIRFYALHTSSARILRHAATRLNSPHFDFVAIPAEAARFEAIPIHGEYTRATYMRLMLPEILPDVSRLVYLDTDTVLNRSVADLFDTDLRDRPVAACVDIGIRQNLDASLIVPGFAESPRDHLALLDLAPEEYFNAGVMVIDLDCWRRDALAAKLEQLLLNPPHKLLWQDQDAMNLLFRNDYVALDPRWNCLAVILAGITPERPAAAGLADIYEQWADDPWIVHYAGQCKPWSTYHRSTPLDDYFWRAVERSPFCYAFHDNYRANLVGHQRLLDKRPAEFKRNRLQAAILEARNRWLGAR